jgi:glycosyltransferase involved in cell wall biosynthesis
MVKSVVPYQLLKSRSTEMGWRDSVDSVTVVVCAYTEARWATLRRAIDSVLKQMNFGDELLVVIDHNDALLALCREGIAGCVSIPNRYSRGLSGARNTAVEEARGEIVAFLDDDAIPVDGWLDAIRAPYADSLVHGVGGLASPHWSGGKPRWFPDEFLWVVGCSYRGLPFNIQPVRNPVGANMSFRRVAFDAAGMFSETIGRVGDVPLSCEETEFSIRMSRANPGAIILYNPSARVEHHVLSQRRSVRYFVRRCWAEGMSKAEVARRVGASAALGDERRYTLQVLPRGVWQGLRDARAGDFWGVARAWTILLGVVVTSGGYCIGRWRNSL